MQPFVEMAAQHPQWHWYAIADAAQSKALPTALTNTTGMAHRCLFNVPEGSPVAAKSPHLVALPTPSETSVDSAWKWIERNAQQSPCVTVLASTLAFDALHTHFQQWTEVLLPDGDDLFFAFWDPMILATLMGQEDDDTLYVRGAVLDAAQRAALTRGIEGWWYWDRDGGSHALVVDAPAQPPVALPIQLTQEQVDALVEASVPDQVFNHLQTNQPGLFHDFPDNKRYGYVLRMLRAAKQLGLSAMKDLVNFASLGLIYRERMAQDPQILQLLQQVQSKAMTLDEAMALMPQ